MSDVHVGLRAKFFHPRTLGVMHWGTVRKVHKNGDVTVHFEVDDRQWRTKPDNICAGEG